MNLRIIRLKGKRPDKKNAYFMLPFSMYVLKFCTICSDRRHISDCQGMRIVGQGGRKIKGA